MYAPMTESTPSNTENSLTKMTLPRRVIRNIMSDYDDEDEKLRRIKIAMARKRRLREQAEDEEIERLNRMFPVEE